MMSSKHEKDMDKVSGRRLEMVISVITLPPDKRLDNEIASLAPWLCKRSPVLQQLPKGRTP